jgi:hypothetical protein
MRMPPMKMIGVPGTAFLRRFHACLENEGLLALVDPPSRRERGFRAAVAIRYV